MVIGIVEDDRTAARLLKDLLEAEGFEVGGVWPSGEEALSALDGSRTADLVFMDLRLPGMSGIEATRVLKARYGNRLDVVVQTMFEDAPTILEAIRAGISGYLLKGSPPEEVLGALAEVRRGGSFLSGKVARKILQELGSAAGGATPCGPEFLLSDREEEILRLLVDGLSYKQIAGRLFLSVFTVNNHLRKVYEKMRVGSRAEAAAAWIKTRDPTGCSD